MRIRKQYWIIELARFSKLPLVWDAADEAKRGPITLQTFKNPFQKCLFFRTVQFNWTHWTDAVFDSEICKAVKPCWNGGVVYKRSERPGFESQLEKSWDLAKLKDMWTVPKLSGTLVSTHVRIRALPHTMYLQDKRRAQYYREQSDLLHVLRMQCMKSALNKSYVFPQHSLTTLC